MKFQTAGPCIPGKHYMLSPDERVPHARTLINNEDYFVLHAPRQSGKTTAMELLAREFTEAGTHVALRFSCGSAPSAFSVGGNVESTILEEICLAAEMRDLTPDLMPPSTWPHAEPGSRLRRGLFEWARQCPLPLVLIFDEIDALKGPELENILQQLRNGYLARPSPFPASVVLSGVRDLRDYKLAAGGDPDCARGASPFNIVSDSLRLADFTDDQVAELYGQHATATGQPFTDGAIRRAFDLTGGQPWLINALGAEAVRASDSEEPIAEAAINAARDRLISAYGTHFTSLAARLLEPRVRAALAPLTTGEQSPGTSDVTFQRDLSYVRDLGLIASDAPIRPANPMYREVMLRVLAANAASTANIAVDKR